MKKKVSVEDLMAKNRKVLESVFDTIFEGGYEFPNNFEDKLFDRMIKVEHNRWNAYNYLNGWEYSNTKNKTIKKHDCLLHISEFPKYF